MSKKRILCIGLVCLDVVNVVEDFPLEDSDQRSVKHYKSRGGNASNNCSILAELGEKPEFFGTMAENALETRCIEKDFIEYGIIIKNCPKIKGATCPYSCVILNSKNGSRTIIHTNPNLPELTFDQFRCRMDQEKEESINLSWIHFEGRNVKNLPGMIDYVRINFSEMIISIEIEKVKRGLETLIPLGDVVFISKDVAKYHGASNPEEAFKLFITKIQNGGDLIIPWGELGAIVGRRDGSNKFIEIPPREIIDKEEIVDTLGAGDAFIGAFISAKANGKSLETSAQYACQIAGLKIKIHGFKGLKEKIIIE